MNQPKHKTFYIDVSDTEGEAIVDESGETIAWVAVKKPISVEDLEVCEKCGRELKNE